MPMLLTLIDNDRPTRPAPEVNMRNRGSARTVLLDADDAPSVGGAVAFSDRRADWRGVDARLARCTAPRRRAGRASTKLARRCVRRARGPMTGGRTVPVHDHPIVEQLLRDAAPRAAAPLPARERVVETAGGAALLLAVAGLAAATGFPAAAPVDLVVAILAYIAARRVEFQVGAGTASPCQ